MGLVGSLQMFGTRVSGHHHVEFEVLLSDWRAPTKRNRLSSIELLINIFIHLGLSVKTHVGIH